MAPIGIIRGRGYRECRWTAQGKTSGTDGIQEVEWSSERRERGGDGVEALLEKAHKVGRPTTPTSPMPAAPPNIYLFKIYSNSFPFNTCPHSSSRSLVNFLTPTITPSPILAHFVSSCAYMCTQPGSPHLNRACSARAASVSTRSSQIVVNGLKYSPAVCGTLQPDDR